MSNQAQMASEQFHILPYSLIVGQEKLKLALELAYIEPRIGGVLISGDRGTAKSTAVRAFSLMVYGKLPTTLPINATEDRVVGGWKIEELMRGKPQRQSGLLELANHRMLYIDEVNLLDDHIVNIILDVTSTHVLVIEMQMARTWRELAHAKAWEFLISGLLILVGGYIVFADSFSGTATNLAAVFFWAFGLDVGAGSLTSLGSRFPSPGK